MYANSSVYLLLYQDGNIAVILLWVVI